MEKSSLNLSKNLQSKSNFRTSCILNYIGPLCFFQSTDKNYLLLKLRIIVYEAKNSISELFFKAKNFISCLKV